MEKMKDLNEIKHKLIDWVKTETAKGFESPAEVEILGEVVDMIKDLASAEESCMEAAYYENVTEAMENYEADGGEGRMGYDRWRYSSGHPTDGRTMTRDGRTTANSGIRYGYTTNDRMGHQKPSEKLDETIDVMGDIWAESDHDTKVKMKGLVRDLLAEMENSGV